MLKPLEVLREWQILYIFHLPPEGAQESCTVKPKMRRVSVCKRRKKRLNKYRDVRIVNK